MRPNYLPTILKHCALAIYHDVKTRIPAKNKKDRFIQSMMIARSRLQQYGFIILQDDLVYGQALLTDKGRIREQKHLSEGRAKTVFFDTVFRYFDIDGSIEKARQEKNEKARQQYVENKSKAQDTKPTK